jgi:flagellar biosynthetic protein FlhB
MAGDQDPAQKTEDPTQKRLADAEKKGQVAKSQEIGHWFMLTAATIGLIIMSTSIAGDVKSILFVFLEQPHAIAVDTHHLQTTMWNLIGDISLALFPLIGLLGIAGLAGNLVQHKPVFSAHKLKPELSKLSLAKGFKRLFSSRSLMEFVKGIVKITVVGVVAVMVVWPELDQLPLLITMETQSALEVLRDIAIMMLISVVSVITIVAAIDFAYQRQQHTQQLRMTKQEVKDEHKQTEGDPMVKQRLRSIRMERSRKRMMAAVPEADVVVTNPTHFSVALKYEQESMAAPKVVAKGQDHLAKRIREVAKDNDVPIVENPPLARALHASVDIDESIPVEHFQAVAEVIGYVMRLKGSMPQNRTTRVRAR